MPKQISPPVSGECQFLDKNILHITSHLSISFWQFCRARLWWCGGGRPSPTGRVGTDEPLLRWDWDRQNEGRTQHNTGRRRPNTNTNTNTPRLRFLLFCLLSQPLDDRFWPGNAVLGLGAAKLGTGETKRREREREGTNAKGAGGLLYLYYT